MKRIGPIGLVLVGLALTVTSKISAQTVIEREVKIDTIIDENGKQVIKKTISVKAENSDQLPDSAKTVEVKVMGDEDRVIMVNGKQVEGHAFNVVTDTIVNEDGTTMIKVRVDSGKEDAEELIEKEETFEVEMDVEKVKEGIIIINGEKIDLGATEMEPGIIEGGKFLWIEEGVEKGLEEAQEKIYQIKVMIEDEDFQENLKKKIEVAKEIAKIVKGSVKDFHFEVKNEKAGTLIERELVRDGFIQKGEGYLLKLSAEKMQINGEKQSKSIAQKYAELYERQTGIELAGKSSVVIEENK
jgi:hypothetical protein